MVDKRTLKGTYKTKQVYCRGHYGMSPHYMFSKTNINKKGDKGMCRECVNQKNSVKNSIHEELKNVDSPLRVENQMMPITFKQKRLKDRMKGETAQWQEKAMNKKKKKAPSRLDLVKGVRKYHKMTTLMIPLELTQADVKSLDDQRISV